VNRLRVLGAAALVLIMAAACSRGQQGGPASSPPSPPTPGLRALAAPQNLSTNLERAGQMARAAPAAGYDVSARARELGPDVDTVLTFVRDRVRYEVYAGVLRGPRGTLMTLAGNSYDKSALFGALLTAHGVRVRYARARLSEEQAGVLVSRMFAMAAGSLRDPRPPGGQDTRWGYTPEPARVRGPLSSASAGSPRLSPSSWGGMPGTARFRPRRHLLLRHASEPRAVRLPWFLQAQDEAPLPGDVQLLSRWPG